MPAQLSAPDTESVRLLALAHARRVLGWTKATTVDATPLNRDEHLVVVDTNEGPRFGFRFVGVAIADDDLSMEQVGFLCFEALRRFHFR